MHLTIIMPVLNEAAGIVEQLHHLAALSGVPLSWDILVVDGGSSDGTPALATQALGSRGQVIHSTRGRATQMNAGAKAAEGDILLFLHADTRLPENASALIAEALADERVIGGAFLLGFDRVSWRYRLVAATTNVRSRLSKTFTGDQALFVRRAVFQRLGAFPEQPLMEDIEFSQQMRRYGQVALLTVPVTTSARRHEAGGLWKTIVFMWGLRLLYTWGVPAERLHRLYLDIR